MDNNRLNKKVFLWDQAICKENWSSSFKVVLEDMNLENYWLNNMAVPMDLTKNKSSGKTRKDLDTPMFYER